MKINLLTFGIAKEICGQSSFELEVPEGIAAGQLLQLLQQQYPRLRQIKSFLLAVNSEYAPEEQLLSASDEVAIIPPVSGG